MAIVLNLKTAKGKPILRGHDHFWSVIMEKSKTGPFTLSDIDLASNVPDKGSIKLFVRRLEKAKLVERVGSNSETGAISYRPLIRQSVAPRFNGNGTVIESQPATRCMWNLMRGPVGRGGFTFYDLVQLTRTDEISITVQTAKAYIKILNRAGYLITVRASDRRSPTIWRLDPRMNTGPQAPMILRTKLVFDQNRQEVFGPADAEEVQP